jgi:hypothetical protein
LGGSNEFARLALAQVPAIVPPVASKMLYVGGTPRDGFVDEGHQRVMRAIWASFFKLVSSAIELVVIGYSLPGTDAASIAVLKQFAPSQDVQKQKRVLIVDKNPEVVNRYRHFVHPNAALISHDFDSFVP